ncbi:MAG: DNA repair protein RadC [Proteobacteria bacterium]|jgi:DNA repair protein RadC|nr:DNA repair protein RadC [Pseudomonadota bacterium]
MKKKTIYVASRKITCVSEPTSIERVKITSSKMGAEFARKFYHDDIELYESVFLIMLNSANIITSYAKISQGGIAGAVVDPKIIMKYAVDDLAASVIMVHNHPSGNLVASGPDKTITEKVKNALSFIDCKLLDHIILSKTDYLSFADDGLL